MVEIAVGTEGRKSLDTAGRRRAWTGETGTLAVFGDMTNDLPAKVICLALKI
jgi:hypothetical protein